MLAGIVARGLGHAEKPGKNATTDEEQNGLTERSAEQGMKVDPLALGQAKTRAEVLMAREAIALLINCSKP
ncbi:MAG: hypothetical protein Fur0046_02610 [Cyanobacteria bacterium J069]